MVVRKALLASADSEPLVGLHLLDKIDSNALWQRVVSLATTDTDVQMVLVKSLETCATETLSWKEMYRHCHTFAGLDFDSTFSKLEHPQGHCRTSMNYILNMSWRKKLSAWSTVARLGTALYSNPNTDETAAADAMQALDTFLAVASHYTAKYALCCEPDGRT